LLSYQTTQSKVVGSREALEWFRFVTVNGEVEFEDEGRVARIAYYYSKAVKAGINLALRGVPLNDAVKELYKVIPYAFYAETAYKQASALVKNNGNKVEVKGRWLACRGSKADKGNRGIKLHVLEDHVEVRVKDPWGGWVAGKAYFGRKYLPLLRELEELSEKGEEGYGAVISFKEKPTIHLQVPLWLYLKHFSSPKPKGYGLVAGLDLNSDRLNVVVINKEGEVITFKTWWYSEVVSHGFPKEKAKALRLSALSQALTFLSRVGVDYVVFEDLFLIKRRKFAMSKSGNRKVSRFAKRQMLTHGVIKALRLGFNVVLVNPKGTTDSKEHEKVMREKGFDRHTASAYLIALRGLEVIKDNE
jgi:predicted transposase